MAVFNFFERFPPKFRKFCLKFGFLSKNWTRHVFAARASPNRFRVMALRKKLENFEIRYLENACELCELQKLGMSSFSRGIRILN
jgi:hypothetical protein